METVCSAFVCSFTPAEKGKYFYNWETLRQEQHLYLLKEMVSAHSPPLLLSLLSLCFLFLLANVYLEASMG